MKFSPKMLLYPLIAVVATLLDLLSKQWILQNLQPYQSRDVIGDLLRFTFVWNQGITFGMFNGVAGSESWKPFVLVALATVALGLVVFMFFNLSRYLKDGWPQTAGRLTMMFIAGGALGNIIDRLMHHAVVDFIDMGLGKMRWYTYNVADCFVVVGAISLGLLFFFFEKKPTKAETADEKLNRS